MRRDGRGVAARVPPLRVEVVSRLRRGAGASSLRRFLEDASRAMPPPRGARLALCLLSDPAMRRLNSRFRGKPGTTDVLAFPAAEGRAPDGGVDLGDIAISVPRARRQAREQGHSLARELRVLALHGYLHLIGFDHETDRGEMSRLEARLRTRLLRGRRSVRGGRTAGTRT